MKIKSYKFNLKKSILLFEIRYKANNSETYFGECKEKSVIKKGACQSIRYV